MRNKRIQFYNPEDFITSDIQRTVQKTSQQFEENWAHVKKAPQFSPIFTYKGRLLWKFVEPALTHVLLREGKKMVRDFESTKVLLRKFKINNVLLRCSVNTQTHYFSIAKAAHTLNIPAVEIQHGLEYNGKGSFSARKNTDYIAVYGPTVKRELEAIGNKDIPDLQLIIKLRQNFFETLHRKIIPRTLFGKYAIVVNEPLPTIFAVSDFVISGSSTVLLEAMVSKKPLVLWALNSYERMVLVPTFAPFINTNSVLLATNMKDLISSVHKLAYSKNERKAIVDKMVETMRQEYVFDGNASKRIAQLLSSPQETSVMAEND